MSPIRRHLLALAGIVALGLPILVVDLLLLGPRGSGWAALDFRGFLVGAYGIVALLFWVLSGLVAFAIRPRLLGCLGYAGVAAALVFLLGGAAAVYFAVGTVRLDRELAAESEAMQEEARDIGRDVVLERWSIEEGEVAVDVRSGRSRALCLWSVQGYAGYERQLAAEDFDEDSCDLPGPHQALPAGTSPLRRAYQLDEGGSLERVDRWQIELWIVGVVGMTRLVWETGAAEEILPGTYQRPLPPAGGASE